MIWKENCNNTNNSKNRPNNHPSNNSYIEILLIVFFVCWIFSFCVSDHAQDSFICLAHVQMHISWYGWDKSGKTPQLLHTDAIRFPENMFYDIICFIRCNWAWCIFIYEPIKLLRPQCVTHIFPFSYIFSVLLKRCSLVARTHSQFVNTEKYSISFTNRNAVKRKILQALNHIHDSLGSLDKTTKKYWDTFPSHSFAVVFFLLYINNGCISFNEKDFTFL